MRLAIRTITVMSALGGSLLLHGCGGEVTPFAKPPTLTDKALGLYEVQTTAGDEIMLSIGANLAAKAVVYSIKANYAYNGPVTIAQDGTYTGTLSDFYGGSTVLNITGKVAPGIKRTDLGTFSFASTGAQTIKEVKGTQRSQGLENAFKGTYKGSVDFSYGGDPVTGSPPSSWSDTLTVAVDGQGNVKGTFADGQDQAYWGFTNHVDEFGNDNGFFYWDYYYDSKGARHFGYDLEDFLDNTSATGILDDTATPAVRRASLGELRARRVLRKGLRKSRH